MFKWVEERLSMLSRDKEDITRTQSPTDKKHNILKIQQLRLISDQPFQKKKISGDIARQTIKIETQKKRLRKSGLYQGAVDYSKQPEMLVI